MLNQIVLTGNLGQDPEIFFTSEGNSIAKFSLAFKTSKNKSTSWIKVACFGRLAELAEKHLHQGARVGVIGTLDENKWENSEGEKKSAYQISANTIEFIKTNGKSHHQSRNQIRHQ